MLARRFLTLFIVMAIVITPILSSLSVLSDTTVSSSDLNASEVPESHVIENVPYIAQTEIHFCYFTSMAMIFQYYGINTSIDEIIYYTGVGYSLYYPNPFEDRLPCEGQKLVSGDVVGSIYGFSWEYWYTNKTENSNEESWFKYLSGVKQNVSKNIPVITVVDPHKLPTIPEQLGIIGKSIYLREPPSGHLIIILGYNDTNGTICYHDSIAGYYGDPSYGTYFWLDMKDFRTAVESAYKPYYSFEIFKNLTEVDPLPKEEAFEKVHKINIERLKGNISAYYDWYDSPISINESEEHQLGINASIAFKKDLEKGLNNRIKTIYLYKLKGKLGFIYNLANKLYHLSSILFPESPMTKFLNPNKMSVFYWIIKEKLHTAQYLWNNTAISKICSYDANLFDRCAENWSNLLDCYSVFMKKGIFLSLPRAILLMNKMADTMDNIIAIEEAIIAGPGED